MSTLGMSVDIEGLRRRSLCVGCLCVTGDEQSGHPENRSDYLGGSLRADRSHRLVDAHDVRWIPSRGLAAEGRSTMFHSVIFRPRRRRRSVYETMLEMVRACRQFVAQKASRQ